MRSATRSCSCLGYVDLGNDFVDLGDDVVDSDDCFLAIRYFLRGFLGSGHFGQILSSSKILVFFGVGFNFPVSCGFDNIYY